MAISAATVWEVRTDGADDQGGGFVAGASGTDRSQQASAQATYTDLVIDGTTNTDMTSAATPFTAADIGNIVNITSGTGFTVQQVEIVSIPSGNIARCDKSLGTLGSTGGNGKLGGALLTIGAAVSRMIAGNDCYVRGGTYTLTAELTLNQNGASSYNPCRYIGYSTTRGDNGRPIIQHDGIAAGFDIVAIDSSDTVLSNFVVDGQDISSTIGIACAGGANRMVVHNCIVRECASRGIQVLDGDTRVMNCRVTDMAAGAASAFYSVAAGVIFYGCTADTNPCLGFDLFGGGAIRCLADTNTGASSDGFKSRSSVGGDMIACTSYNNGRDGFRYDGSFSCGAIFCNNIADSNGGYGLDVVGASDEGPFYNDYNAYRNNTSGARNNAGTGDNDVTLTAVPFTNAAIDDFSLNSTAGGGAACKDVGFPGPEFLS